MRSRIRIRNKVIKRIWIRTDADADPQPLDGALCLGLAISFSLRIAVLLTQIQFRPRFNLVSSGFGIRIQEIKKMAPPKRKIRKYFKDLQIF
jgi:hypothetical protein